MPAHRQRKTPNVRTFHVIAPHWLHHRIIISLNTMRVDLVDETFRMTRPPRANSPHSSTRHRERDLSHHVVSVCSSRCVRDARVHEIIARHVTAFDDRARRHRASSTTAFKNRRPGRPCVELRRERAASSRVRTRDALERTGVGGRIFQRVGRGETTDARAFARRRAASTASARRSTPQLGE